MAVETTRLFSLRFSNPGRVTKENPSVIVLRSGVNLPDAPERRELALLLKRYGNNPVPTSDMAKIDGIDPIESRFDYHKDYDCADYVFRSVTGLHWYKDKMWEMRLSIRLNL